MMRKAVEHALKNDQLASNLMGMLKPSPLVS